AIMAITVAVIAFECTSLWSRWWFFLALIFGAAYLALAFISIPELFRWPSRYHSDMIIEQDIPTFIIRGVRDEATLTIGLAQAVHAAFRLIFEAQGGGLPNSPSMNLATKFVAMAISMTLGSLWLNQIPADILGPSSWTTGALL